MSKDYYKILGVNKNASKEEIKKAFHKLAHQHHPDKNGGDDAKFKEVNEAYQILSDDKKRSNYDQFGSEGPQGFGGFNQGQGFEGFDFSGFGNGQGFDMGDLGDIFGEFFGGGMRGKSKQRRGQDLSVDIDLNFEEAIFGVKKNISINKKSTCNICHGKGSAPGTKMDSCKVCRGSGKIEEIKRSIFGNFKSVQTCTNCFGTGEIPSVKCRECSGVGILKKNEDINIDIPAGISNGEMLRVSGKGEAINFGQTGDLYVKIKVKPHKIFKRDGNNLLMDLEIKLTDALLGMTYNLQTLDKNNLEIKIPEGINNGELLRVRGKGVPSALGRGDIIIKIIIKMPNRLSRKAKEAIEKLKEEGL